MSQYQHREVEASEAAERVTFDAQAIPEIILSISPCRSGTTALLRVFGSAGLESHYQPLKNILRWRMQGEEMRWGLPRAARLYLKETLGPYTLQEAQFDPLAALLQAGVPAGRLRVFVAGRVPLNCWASWTGWWGGRTCVEIFIEAYRTTEMIRRRALALGIPATVFAYEAIRDNGGELAISRLFARLGVDFVP